MTLRVGRFKHKTLAGYSYIRSITYASLSDFQKRLLACSSVRQLSYLDQERPNIHPALLSGDPTLWQWREKYPQPPTSTYRDLIAQFTKALSAKENDLENVANTCTSESMPLDTLKCVKDSSLKPVKHDSYVTSIVSSKGVVGNIDRYAIKDKSLLQSSAQSQLKSECLFAKNSGGTGNDDKPEKDKPDPLDLETIKNYYIDRIPYFYKQNEDLSLGLHHDDIVFENNYFQKQKILQGITAYQNEQSKLHMKANFMFPSYFFSAVGATTHVEECCVKVHWRFYYLRNIEWMTKYWWKRMVLGVPVIECYNFNDGISTFTVNKDGQVIKHQVDRLMPIQKMEADTLKPQVGAKLATAMGLATPKTSFDTMTRFKKKTEPQG